MNTAADTSSAVSPNFHFLKEYDALLLKSATLAERFLFDDPNTALYKLRQFGELLAKETAARFGVFIAPDDSALTVLRRLEDYGDLTPKAAQLFHNLRKTGNKAVHEGEGSRADALYHLRMARELAIWFHKTFSTKPVGQIGPFIPPPDPAQSETSLKEELDALRKRLAEAKKIGENEAEKRAQLEQKSKELFEEMRAAMSLAEETEEQLVEEKKKFQEYIDKLHAEAKADSTKTKEYKEKAQAAEEQIHLSEADTRKLIDEQLQEAGWEADSQELTYKKGVRPQKGKSIAIAEWPTKKGPADYVLFIGLTAVAIVEAKKKNKDVAGSIEQSKRYSKGFEAGDGWELAGGPWGKYRVPFLFATNGRPYLRQLLTKSGIWFLDARLSTNHPKALNSWYTPEGLKGLLEQDKKAAEEKLKREPTNYLGLREYQIEAIRAAEQAIAAGKQTALLAMATGTGKTRTCIGLTYRLLKAKRFRRILFLVDRTSLGEQAADAFEEVKLENLQSFSDIYDVKRLGDIVPESDTRLHIATIQGMIRRLLYSAEETVSLPVDLYDCVVVDECHRGYALDREMTEGELTFRSEQDYISKYTRVLDHFDAIKIGLTATPALHTTEIFGEPVYVYSYRQAVIDGYLIDHEPPIRIMTYLVQEGMTWEEGAEMEVLRVDSNVVDSFNTPDEVKIEVEKFNTAVITENFNKAICAELAKHIDPSLPGKTLVFCSNDSHADMVVTLLKKAFENQYGDVDDDAVQKITAAADKPMQKIRHFKNEKLPSVAVTVDLLTTGIDVPTIVNLVFIRRVKSRILYEQMLGRATRLCEEIGKDVFRIYDTVDLYAALEKYSSMKPVVPNPKITFRQLASELKEVFEDDHIEEIKEQIIVKLRRKRRQFTPEDLEQFERLAGANIVEALENLKELKGKDLKEWFETRPELPSFLDGIKRSTERTVIISTHEDEVVYVTHGYGDYDKPEDYLESFGKYIKENMNKIPALVIVTTKPRDLTRAQLRELKILLDGEGYSETALRTAWKDAKNEEIAASVIGFIRQMALGSPLIPYKERVQRAMKKILSSRDWSVPQKQWLERIGKQLEKETIVDKESLDKDQFKAHGGFNRLNKIFDGKMEEVLGEISEELWADEATA